MSDIAARPPAAERPEGSVPQPRGQEPEPARRAIVLVLLAALLAAGFLVDRIDRPAPALRAGAPPPMPVAGPATAVSTSWFCPGATSGAGLFADGYVAIANPGPDPVTGWVRVVPSEGEHAMVPVTVEPYSRIQVRYQDHVASPFAAGLVELGAGEVAVEQVVFGPNGWSAAPCASSASTAWHIASGSTARGDRLLLSLFNPFPDDAIVDVRFATSEGAAAPQAFRGVVVPGRGLRMLEVGDHVRRRDRLAATVETRRGRLVVGRIQVRGEVGLTWALGAPAPGTEFFFPDGYVADGIAEWVELYNPGDREAVVDVELVLDEGAAEPFEVVVPAGDQLALDLQAEERVPREVAHSIIVRSLNDVPVVVEHRALATTSARRGAGVATGARLAARSWVLAAGMTTDAWDQWLVVQNVSEAAATVDVQALAAGQLLAIDGLQGLEVPGGTRRAIRLGDHIRREDLALLVSATTDVVVERGVFRVGGTGLSYAVGIPLGVTDP